MPDRVATVKSIRDAVAAVTRGERKNARAILRAIENIRRTMLARLAVGGTDFDQAMRRAMLLEANAAVLRLRQELSVALQSQLASAARAGADDMLRQVGSSGLDEALPGLVGIDLDVLDFTTNEADNLVRGLTEQARLDITRIINSGAVGTNTSADVARRLGDVLTESGRSTGAFGRLAVQVERIHRTETATVFSLAQKATATKVVRQVGRVAKKKWVTVLDGRTRIAHRFLNGVTIPFDEHFNVNAGSKWSKVSWEAAKRQGGFLGEKADVPLDPGLSVAQRVNCRCAHALAFGKRIEQSLINVLGLTV